MIAQAKAHANKKENLDNIEWKINVISYSSLQVGLLMLGGVVMLMVQIIWDWSIMEEVGEEEAGGRENTCCCHCDSC